MHIPRWKHYLSYLYEIPIEDSGSAHNPSLFLSLKRGRYQLCTANAVYSFGDLYTNFRRAFQRLELSGLSGDEVLVLGLGLGSIPLLLETVFAQKLHYTAVEIDDVVIEMASRYVLKDLQSPITCLQANAVFFVQQTEEQYDLICMDIFDDDVVPEACESIDYLEALRDRLRPGGLLLYNRLAATPMDKEASNNFYLQRFRQVFPAAECIDVGGNYILLSDARLLRT